MLFFSSPKQFCSASIASSETEAGWSRGRRKCRVGVECGRTRFAPHPASHGSRTVESPLPRLATLPLNKIIHVTLISSITITCSYLSSFSDILLLRLAMNLCKDAEIYFNHRIHHLS
jgi:hypothetical protein